MVSQKFANVAVMPKMKFGHLTFQAFNEFMLNTLPDFFNSLSLVDTKDLYFDFMLSKDEFLEKHKIVKP